MAVIRKQDDNVHVARFGADPQFDRRESVAATLRRARERHGQDVRSVAQVLRIRQNYLEALEAGEYERLPGTAYALGFLRSYAEYLGLDGADIAERFKDEAKGAERRPELVFPEPVAEGRIPGGAVILISVALLGLAYGGWLYLTNQGRSVADLIPALPAQLQALIDGEADTETATPVAETPVDETPVAETPVAETPVAETPVAAAPAETPVPAPAEIAAPARSQRVAVEAPALAVAPQAIPSPPAPSPDPAADRAAAPAPSAAAPEPEAEPAPAPDPAPDQDVELDRPLGAAPAPELATLDQADAPETSDTPPVIEETLDPPVIIPAENLALIPAPPPQAPVGPGVFSQPGQRAPQVYGESSADTRIVVRAVQDSWVQVRDSQDALLLTRVLRSGDVYHVPDQAGLTLLTGNAGGIEIEVDGVTLSPLGPVGAVRRQIALDPALLTGGASRP